MDFLGPRLSHRLAVLPWKGRSIACIGSSGAHGYKAHLAAAKDSGIIRGVETTPANEADVNIAPSIIPDEPGEVYADRAYDALAVEKAIEARGGTPKLMRKGHRWLAAGRREAHNRLLRPIRARIEKIFGTWNRSAHGTVVVGFGDATGIPAGEAFRWTQAGGMAGLGLLPGGAGRGRERRRHGRGRRWHCHRLQ
jgi:hypothetical protein